MGERPIPAVKSLIERNGKILALETEAEGEIYWVLPGGKIEYGEEPVEALKREIMEEISCSVETGNPVGIYHFFTGPEGEGKQVVLTAFEADIGDQKVDISGNPGDENIQQYSWLEPEEFMKRTENESLRNLIRDYAFDTPKLVRDRIPEIIEEDGGEAEIKKVEGKEYEKFLLDKIVEEAKELRDSGKVEELADLEETIEYYTTTAENGQEKIDELRRDKSEDRGGFEEGFVLGDIEDA